MGICSAWRIEHYSARTATFPPTWEAYTHHPTNGFSIQASKLPFNLQLLTTTTTTLASIPEIQACQYQLLLSISLPITRAGQQ